MRSEGGDVEIKHAPGEPGFDPSERLARRVAEVISETSTGGEFVVSSFSLETIDAVLGVNGALETAWLIEPGADVGDAIGTAAYHGHLGVHPYHLFVDEAVVFAAHDLGLAVRAWTVDDGDRISRLGALGVDALITNDVSTALRALGRSGPDSS